MNVANLENCKRLYEFSGWNDCDWGYFKTHDGWAVHLIAQSKYPAYDLGYLLRKLPASTILNTSEVKDAKNWAAVYSNVALEKADTPEDALCLLAIKLFEEGILK